MNTIEIINRLHEEIEHGDERLLNIIYAIIKEYNGDDNLDELRKHLIEEEREKYLKGQGRSYSWDEVKKMGLAGSPS